MKSSSIKSICFIGGGLMGGGMERAFTTLANHYSDNGYEVSLLLLFKTEHFFSLNDTIKIIEPGFSRKKGNKYFYASRTIPYMRKSLRTIRPDVVISYGEWFNPFVIFSTLGLDIPLFVSDRMSPNLDLGLLNKLTKKVFYKRATGIIAQTSYAAEKIRDNTGAKRIKVISNPLVPLEFPAVTRQKQICTLGRLSTEKGHKYLLEAFADITEPGWTLHIIGDGPERENLEKLAANLSITNKVVFHGHLKDFNSILARSSIFVLPSLSEGFPNALIEAMSVPLPCISTDCIAGPSDIIENDLNGILVPPADSVGLRIAIEKLINNESMRLRIEREALKIRDKQSIKVIANDLITFINNCINDND